MYREKGRRSRRQGQTVVEFALVAPVIFLFLFAIVDFGIALDRLLLLDHAVREGARMAAVNDNQSQVCERIVSQAPSDLDSSTIAFAYQPIGGTGTDAGDAIEVSATFVYELPLLRAVVPSLSKITWHPSASARLEKAVTPIAGCP